MIASLLLWSALFATIDPCAPLRDLRSVQERGFNLRTDEGSLWFQPSKPRKYRYQHKATRALWDPWTSSYIQVYVQFPSLYSEATVANGDNGLDEYSSCDEPRPF